MKAVKSLLKFLLISLIVVIALFSLFVAYSSYKKVADLESWNKISATVVSAAVAQEERTKGTTYCPHVMVKYAVQGRPYSSKLDIADGPCSPMQSVVSKTIKQHSPGKVIEVFVNPVDANKVRVASYSLGVNFYLMIFVAVLLFAAAIIWARTPATK
jgi:hypothetical protein